MRNEFKNFIPFISAVVFLMVSTGCTDLPSGPDKATAQKALEAELDKWMRGQESKAKTFTWSLKRYEPPLSYQIRSVIPCKPRISSADWGKLSKEPLKSSIDDRPAFKIVVNLDFRSKANTSISEVGEYTIVWVDEWNEWSIDEITRPGSGS